MNSYALSSLVVAFALAARGAVKGARILLDEIDDALSHIGGLS